MARRGGELDAEALDVIDGVVERMDFQLAAVAGAGIDLADGDRAAEQPARALLQRACRARPERLARRGVRRGATSSPRARTAIGAAACASEVVPRIRAIERLVAEREVRDDVVLDRGFEQRPLEPGRVARVAARDAALLQTRTQTSTSPRNASVMATPSQAPLSVGSTARVSVRRQVGEPCLEQRKLCSISRMRTQTRASTSPVGQHRHLEARVRIRRIGQIAPRVEICGRRRGRHNRRRPMRHQFAGRQCRSCRCDPAATACRRRAARFRQTAARSPRSSARMPRGRPATSSSTPPGTMRSIIRRWPKARSVAASTRSRKMPQ